MISRWLAIGLALALVAMTGTAGVYAYLFARQASTLESALASNKLLSAALDTVVRQSKIDDAAAVTMARQQAEIRATLDQQAETLRELTNDPESKDYLSTRVPDRVRKLFGK